MTCQGCGQAIRDDDWMGIMGHIQCEIDGRRRRQQDPGYQREQEQERQRQRRWADEEFTRRINDTFRYGTQTPPRKHDITLDRVRKLLMLCHPDKHGNSELSTEITRWLIDVKKQLESEVTP